MPFGEIVIGPPGSGKSTYAYGKHQLLTALSRPISVVNLDPANDRTSYKAAVDVRDLVTLDEIMKDDELGPNGGVLYALEELEHNFEWLEGKLKELDGGHFLLYGYIRKRKNADKCIDDYIIFDCPGQAELFTHHASLRNIFFRLEKLGYRVRSPMSTTPLMIVHLTWGNWRLLTSCSS